MLLAGLAGGGLFTGCSTLENRPAITMAAVEPQSRYFARDRAQVFESLVGVLESMHYTISRSASAQGIIEAYGKVLETNTFGESRQFLISARVREVGEGEAGVELIVREAREGDFSAGATRQAHAQHGRYDSIFEALEKALGDGAWLPPSKREESPR